MGAALFNVNREPTLDQLFADPIMRQLMECDGSDEATIRALLKRAAKPRRGPPIKLQFDDTTALFRHRNRRGGEPLFGALAGTRPPPAWPRVFPSL